MLSISFDIGPARVPSSRYHTLISVSAALVVESTAKENSGELKRSVSLLVSSLGHDFSVTDEKVARRLCIPVISEGRWKEFELSQPPASSLYVQC